MVLTIVYILNMKMTIIKWCVKRVTLLVIISGKSFFLYLKKNNIRPVLFKTYIYVSILEIRLENDRMKL